MSKTLIQTHMVSAAVSRHSWTDYSSIQLAAELLLPFFDPIQLASTLVISSMSWGAFYNLVNQLGLELGFLEASAAKYLHHLIVSVCSDPMEEETV